MANIPCSYIKANQSTHQRMNGIIDSLLTPHIMEFRQINIYHERGTQFLSNSFKFTYQNWNESFPVEVFLNNDPNPLLTTEYTINYEMGTISLNSLVNDGDTVLCTYNFSYFSSYVLESFVLKAIEIINTSAVGVTTEHHIDSAPSNWDGVISDIALVLCMEKLILDYDLWKGRLIFAVGSTNFADSSDIISQLESVKNSAQERAFKTLDNQKFKCSPHIALPTRAYFDSLMLGSGGRISPNTGKGAGRLHGWVPNKYMGRIF